MKSLLNRISAFLAGKNVVDSAKAAIPQSMMEQLEDRSLLSVALPHVSGVYADNRGLMTIKFDQKMNATTFTSKSVKVSRATSGADAGINNAILKYNAKTRVLSINARTSADAVFKVRLSGRFIKSVAGARLDGEFNAIGKSGNGRAGGDYFVMTQITPDGTDPVARFTTSLGSMDVTLFRTVNSTLADNRATPGTVTNFLHYANLGDYDKTLFHRSVADFVIQGGGFKVDKTNRFVNLHNNPPTITNEPKNAARPANPGNVRGTIAMARTDDGDPNTNDFDTASDQWYLNSGTTNTFLDAMHGGFTVFGQLTGDLSSATNPNLVVMDKINDRNRIANLYKDNSNPAQPNRTRTEFTKFFNPAGLQPVFTEFPLARGATVASFSPKVHSVLVTRLAVNTAVVQGVKV